jgi:tetratricopeptide (TPR) repeat protein
LRVAEIERARRKRPENLDAYDLYLRALPHAYVAMPDEARKAIPLLERAVELDPAYASAHGMLAWCYQQCYLRAGYDDRDRERCVLHARAALATGGDDVTALTMAAFAKAMIEHDRATALATFDQALALSPSSTTALIYSAIALGWAGEPELAIERAQRASVLSPLDPMLFGAYGAMGMSYFLLERHAEAVDMLTRAIALSPQMSLLYAEIAAPLVRLGRMEEARSAAAKTIELEPQFSAGRFIEAGGLAPNVAEKFGSAWREAGLPE